MYEGLASSPVLIAMVVIGLLAIVGFSLVYFRKAYKRCLEFGMSKEKLMKIIRSSLVFSIVPSVAIVIGLFSLSALFGVVWPWWRLSVVGALAYEMMAGESAVSAMGGDMTKTAFCAIMFAMTLGMAGNMLTPIFVTKKLNQGVKQEKGQNPGWKMVLNSTFFTSMLCVYIPLMFLGSLLTMAVLLTSAAICILIGVIANKLKWSWLNEFNMAFTLILGMMSSLIWVQILA